MSRCSENFRDHIARNGLTNIEVLAVGLTDTEGEANYYAPATTNRGTGSFLAAMTHHEQPHADPPADRAR